MTKAEWQKHHEINDQEMDWILTVKGEFNGTIISVSEVPKDASGCTVPFADRREAGDRMRWIR